MNLFRDFLKRENGVTTLVAVMIVSLVGIVIAGVVPMITQTTNASISNKNQVQAGYAAEAGIKRALDEFSNHTDVEQWDWLNKKVELDAHTKYNVTVKQQSQAGNVITYEVSAEGFVESTLGMTTVSAKRRAIVAVTVQAGEEVLDLFKEYAVYGGTGIDFAGNNAAISGCVATLGTTISNNPWNAISVENKYGTEYQALKANKDKMQLNLKLNGVFDKDQIAYTTYIPAFKVRMANNPAYPNRDEEEMPKVSNDWGTIDTGNTISLNGKYHIQDGLANLYNRTLNLKGDSVLYVDGDLTMSGATKVIGDHQLTIVSTKSVYLTNNSQIDVADLKIYANQNVELSVDSQMKTDACLIVADGMFKMSNRTKISAKDDRLLYDAPVHIYAKQGMNFSNDTAMNGKVILKSDNGDIYASNRFEINPYLLSPQNDLDIQQNFVEIYAKNIKFANDSIVNGTKLTVHALESLEINGADAAFNRGIQRYIAASRNTAYKVETSMFSDGTLKLVNGCFIGGHDTLIQSQGDMELHGALQLNGYMRSPSDQEYSILHSVTRINSHRNILLSANASLGSLVDVHKKASGGLTIAAGTDAQNNYGIITAKGNITSRNYIDATNCLLIGAGNLDLQGNPWFYGVYGMGNVKLNWVTYCKINEGYRNKYDFENIAASIAGKGYLPIVDRGDDQEAADDLGNKVEVKEWQEIKS